MEIDAINPHVMKIMIAARKEDSINAISKRIGLSYGWAYRWAQDLIKEGVFERRGKKIILREDSEFYKSCMDFIKNNFSQSARFYYSVLQLFGVKYCFTKTDAVYVWTDGGYNIARHRGYYPVFIKLKESGFGLFKWHCQKLGLKINAESGAFYSVELKDDFSFAVHNGIPVDSLGETVSFMKKYIYNFQPALEMMHEMYGTNKYNYRESKTNV